MPCLKDDLGEKLDIMYEGDGTLIAKKFYIPVLKSSLRYDRISGYFSADSLVVISAGLAGLIQNGGEVRLVVGVHDIGPDLRRKDYAKHTSFGDHKKDTSLDAVLLTHAHVDHVGYMGFLRPEIPIYCTEGTKLILQALDDTAPFHLPRPQCVNLRSLSR